MSLLAQVVTNLDAVGIRAALIGAEALALRGASRSTLDRDLLTTDRRALDAALWAPLVAAGTSVEIRRGDSDDPLAGVVRFVAGGERPVDLIVGRHGWQTQILERSERLDLDDVRVAVPRSSDLVLLKLFAGGPQDAWDVLQLLAGDEQARIVSEVEARLAELPDDCTQLWRKILAG
jgi:hypothetical protein